MTNQLPRELVDIYNARIADEYDAERFYKRISMWADMNGYKALSDWAVAEMHDEHSHAHRIERELTDWDIMPETPTMLVNYTFNSMPECLQLAYDKEFALKQKYANSIKQIDATYPDAEVFLQKFSKIQNKACKDLRNKLSIINGVSDKSTLLLLSEEIFG